MRADLRGLRQALMLEAFEELRSRARDQDPRHLVAHGYRSYSQNDEDGIIREIFNRVGTTSRTFVEFGIGTGLENNTLALLYEGWRGLWIEAADESARSIRENLQMTIADGTLQLIHSRVTAENINDLISSAMNLEEIDLLSIDIDGNDIHVFKAIHCIKPRVVVIEYNPTFRPPTLFCIDYDPEHVWRRDDCLGASLKLLEVEFENKGYSLVACNVTGANAFFVRNDLVSDQFMSPFTAEVHYQPSRIFMGDMPIWHRPSFRTLENSRQCRAGERNRQSNPGTDL
jgi:hypothetical protein